ncbi:MAG: hypothetical protein ACHQ4H_09780 [Ktedonobacterales bacterium]
MSTHNIGPRGFSKATVREKTGRGSAERYALLDAWGAAAKGHTATAKYLRDQQGVSAWWAQALTNRYEWERGMRPEQAR